MKLRNKKKIYFASDNHLGSPNFKKSLEREKVFVKWLDYIRVDAQEIFLLGDLIDFWFEYDKVIPKGFVRTFGKLAEICDSGIKVNFFPGNHDHWVNDYFEKELGLIVWKKPKEIKINDHVFFVGHGDGLGPKDYGYKFLKVILTNRINKFLFKLIHPDLGVRLGQFLSKKNKIISGNEKKFLGKEKEWLINFCQLKLKEKNFNYFIFGHRHLPMKVKLNKDSSYINLGDWISNFTYAVYNGETINLKSYSSSK